MNDSASGQTTFPLPPATDQTIQLYNEIGAYERHFNEIQSEYRKIASQWLLAAFGAIGFLLYGKDIGSPAGLPPQLIAAGVALAAVVGLLLLWHLDVHVYHRLLKACFRSGLCLEAGHTGLPSIRHAMREDETTVSAGINRFYFVAQAVMTLLGLGIAWGYWCLQYGMIGEAERLTIWTLTTVLGLATVVALSWLWRARGEAREDSR
ncbi:MAG: hypothetical protein MUC79_04570 [Thiobacillaceae bacterium]|jgi:hypothetical protein|nr:hypothetical protein [Thiobacillaceae bacterium]